MNERFFQDEYYYDPAYHAELRFIRYDETEKRYWFEGTDSMDRTSFVCTYNEKEAQRLVSCDRLVGFE